MFWKKRPTEEDRANAWMNAQMEVHRRYLQAMTPVLERLLFKANPALDPKRCTDDWRDSFAKAALAALLSNPKAGDQWSDEAELVAERAYEYAEAMLKEREKHSS